jgi:hypothetical protein
MRKVIICNLVITLLKRDFAASTMTSDITRSCLYRVFIVQAYQTSQYVVPRGGVSLSKWRSSFAGNSDGKMNVQSACALNTRYNNIGLMNGRTSIGDAVQIKRYEQYRIFPPSPTRVRHCYKPFTSAVAYLSESYMT